MQNGAYFKNGVDNCHLITNCCRNSAPYRGDHSKNVGQDGESRKQTGTQKQKANHAEPNVDVKPSEKDTPSVPGQCFVMIVVCVPFAAGLLFCFLYFLCCVQYG